MSEQDKEVEIEVVSDDTVEIDESTTDSEQETVETSSEEDNSLGNAKKNSSNFKKLAKAKKDAEKALEEERKRRKEAERRLALDTDSEDDDDDEDYSDSPEPSTEGNLERRLFFIENPEAKEYADEIEEELAQTPGLPLEKALALAKASSPRSGTKQDINIGTPRRTIRKRMSDLNDGEAVENLSNSDYLKWLRTQGTQV